MASRLRPGVMVGVLISATPVFAQSTNDIWDISRGCTVVTHSSFDACLGQPHAFDDRDFFGGFFGECEPGQVVFDDNAPGSFVDFVEWQIPDARRISTFKVYRTSDCPQNPPTPSRGISHLKLMAKDITNGNWVTLFNADVPVYGFCPAGDPPITASVVAPFATEFRAEFSRAASPSFQDGPRVVELDADICVSFASQPASALTCISGTATFSAAASGTGPLAYHWQIEIAPPGSNMWSDLFDGQLPLETGSSASAGGSDTSTLTITSVDLAAASRFRCSSSNACDIVISDPAVLAVFAGGSGDGDAGGATDGADIQGLVNVLMNGVAPSAAYCAYDMNVDGVVDMNDVPMFVALLML